jgi:oligopeptidase B
MRFSGFSAIALLFAAATAFAQPSSAPEPPIAKKVHTEKPINGSVLVDDYAWLRERTSPAVHEYLEAENAYAEQSTADEKPFADKLYNETLSHIKQTDVSVPYRKHVATGITPAPRREAVPNLCRKKETLSAPEEVMLDVNELAKGEKFMSLGGDVSDDSNLLAYTTDNVGFRQYKLHIKDLRTGKLLPDTAERVDSVSVGRGQQDTFLLH